MLDVTQAKYLQDYKIKIMFSDNLKGVIDLQNVIKDNYRAIFQELKRSRQI